jgi:hypothetical protein
LSCAAWGGNLAGISSSEEYNFIVMNVSDDDYWIGARSDNADGDPMKYAWVNGEAWGLDGWATTASVQPWKSGSPAPNEPCVKMHGGFESRLCDDKPGHGCLCERP